jgi:tetratricopeptide (TPR) repeat protein
VVVLRCTQKLLRRLRASSSPDAPASDTTLGDWYATHFQFGRSRFALFISERTRLPIVLDGADLKRLPVALAERLDRVLGALGVDERARAEECARMSAAVFAATSSRSVVGSLNEAVSMARTFLAHSPALTPLELALDLAEVPAGPLKGAASGDVAAEALGRAAADSEADTIDLVFLANSGRSMACRRLPGWAPVWLRARRFWGFVPGEILGVRPSTSWTDEGRDFMAGEVVSARIDAKALGLAPLRLERMGAWDPADEYWGEDGDPIDEWAKPIIARGPRPQFEMEQVLPGLDLDNPDSDPICLAIDRKDRGDRYGARESLMALCEADLRCLDAHAHLGNFVFDDSAELAMRHYEVGMRIGELSLGDGFDGVLSWGLIDNRPFLRCLYGYGLCLWRLKRFEEAAGVFERILWLNPSDNQGARFVIDAVRTRHPWTPHAS